MEVNEAVNQLQPIAWFHPEEQVDQEMAARLLRMPTETLQDMEEAGIGPEQTENYWGFCYRVSDLANWAKRVGCGPFQPVFRLRPSIGKNFV